MYERENPTPLWFNEPDGFLCSHECAVLQKKKLSSCKSSGVFAGRNESLGIGDIWGKSYWSYSGVIGFFTMALGLPLGSPAFGAKMFHIGDLFQKTAVVLERVQSSLWRVKDTLLRLLIGVSRPHFQCFLTFLSVLRRVCTCPCIFFPSKKAQCGKSEASIYWPT